jgi:hypothetical protein
MRRYMFARNIHQKGGHFYGQAYQRNVFLDPEVLRRAQGILDAQSGSEAIREALNLVVFRQEVRQEFDKVAGNIPDFWDI